MVRDANLVTEVKHALQAHHGNRAAPSHIDGSVLCLEDLIPAPPDTTTIVPPPDDDDPIFIQDPWLNQSGGKTVDDATSPVSGPASQQRDESTTASDATLAKTAGSLGVGSMHVLFAKYCCWHFRTNPAI